MPVASLSWRPSRTYPRLPSASSSPLILPSLAPPYSSSTATSDQFPCSRLGPNGGPDNPRLNEATENPLEALSRPVVFGGAAVEEEIKK